MKKKIVHKNKIRWGLPLIILMGIAVLLSMAYMTYAIRLIIFLIQNPKLMPIVVLLITLFPLLALDFIFFPVFKGVLFELIRKEDSGLVLYTTGIEINRLFLEWKKIKSISFNSGRINRKDFFRGFGLPALQEIYILDKKGKEYSCTIDIDYSLKKDRENNNLREIRDMLLGLEKARLISDWAQRF
ncbi:hypothetical protein JXC34_06220 [Candidatus Woesearchaeota archaeon]|nr:hypothetical protein [Candidatus Woesearchaeota archaeon]